MTTDQAAERHRYTNEEREALTQQVVAALASGMTQRQAAERFNMPLGSVAVLSAAAKSVILMQDYREVVLADAKRYAAKAWLALDVQLGLLGDKKYLQEHGGEVFGLASAHRVIAETLGRILAAVGE